MKPAYEDPEWMPKSLLIGLPEKVLSEDQDLMLNLKLTVLPEKKF